MRSVILYVSERIVLAVLFALVVAAVPDAAGGGAYLRMFGLLLAPIATVLAIGLAITLGIRRPRNAWLTDAAVRWMTATFALPLVILSLRAGMSLGDEIRAMTAFRVASRCDRIGDSLEACRRATGSYPDRLPAQWERSGIDVIDRDSQLWGALIECDAALLLSGSRYLWVIPIERPNRIIQSFTSSTAWLRSSDDDSWRQERLTWILTVGS